LIQLNELSVRSQDGSRALRFVRWRGSLQDYKSPRLVILVHGFNTSEPGAWHSYMEFLKNLESLSDGCLGPGTHSKGTSSFWAFYWPGDHSKPLVGKLDMLGLYNARKGNAETSGRSLGELILRMSPEQEVILVGHSMGCRVVLEALAYIAQMRQYRVGGARVSTACLMAAAVAIGECDGDEAPYRRRAGEPTELVLYSNKDRVLNSRLGYKAAEWLYDSQEGAAVGATGQPNARWLESPKSTNLPENTELGHLHYWDSKESARRVGRFLAGRPATEAAARAGPEERSREQPRHEQPARAPATRAAGDVRTLPWLKCFNPP
jgi:pimeloyl-ACP methyl ester carboxylesterase